MAKTDQKSSGKRKLPPCRIACPADINVQGYVALIQQGKFKESVELIRKSMPFPAICGRVCFSPCQDGCVRKEIDQPVGIRNLKRLAADIEREQGRVKPKPIPKKHREKVAVIGAGPAGLSAAYELVKLGYPVTVFERMSQPGGMMRYCIPDFRLQRYVVANEIAYIRDLGVEIKTGAEFGKDFNLESLSKQGYKATFVAIGAQTSQKLGVPGEELRGVYPAVELLRNHALGQVFDIREKVAIIGGGNSAIDAARTSLRLGAREVTILYRRSRKEMPALPYEVDAAEKEGVKFQFLVSPKRIIGEGGRVKAVECFRMELGEPDASGRRRPVPVPGSEHTYEVDTVVPAIGQVIEACGMPDSLLTARADSIAADPTTLETGIPGVFAGGDIVTGPASVIEAVGAGKQAAISIDRYLSGEDLRAGREREAEETTWVKNQDAVIRKPERYESPHMDRGRSEVSFEEADRMLARTKESAILEARRCLGCGPCTECLGAEGLCDADKAMVDEAKCTGCGICVLVCPYSAVTKNDKGIAQVDEDICKGCGICCASCPERAISMKQFTEGQIIDDVAKVLRRQIS
jgi:heterodisulfide reductase subunit A